MCNLCCGRGRYHTPRCPRYVGGLDCDCGMPRCPMCRVDWMGWTGLFLVVVACITVWALLWWPR